AVELKVHERLAAGVCAARGLKPRQLGTVIDVDTEPGQEQSGAGEFERGTRASPRRYRKQHASRARRANSTPASLTPAPVRDRELAGLAGRGDLAEEFGGFAFGVAAQPLRLTW